MSRLPPDTIIAPAKLKDYLLIWRGKDDKSKWLAAVGYTLRFTRIGVNKMAYTLFEQVALTRDIPEKNLRRGDVATIVEHHPTANTILHIRDLKVPA